MFENKQQIILVIGIVAIIYMLWSNQDNLKKKFDEFEKRQRDLLREELENERKERDKYYQQQSEGKKRERIKMNIEKNDKKPEKEEKINNLVSSESNQEEFINSTIKNVMNSMMDESGSESNSESNISKNMINNIVQSVMSDKMPSNNSDNTIGTAMALVQGLGMMKSKEKPMTEQQKETLNTLMESDFVKKLLDKRKEKDFELDYADAMKNTISMKNKYYMDIVVENKFNGRVVIELFDHIVPNTCNNFKKLLCNKPPHKSYVNVPFHRLIKDFLIQGGDITNHDGTGGKSIYGKTFPDENFKSKHNQEGLLSMANNGPNTNNSQFFIILHEEGIPQLDDKHVVFGIITSGFDFLMNINQNIDVDDNDMPLNRIYIDDCGEMTPESGEESYPDTDLGSDLGSDLISDIGSDLGSVISSVLESNS